MDSNKQKNWLILFSVGFLLYIGIEVVFCALLGALVDFKGMCYWSLGGYSSIWMGLVGGVAFTLLGMLNEVKRIRTFPLALQCLLGAVLITTLEFVVGLILNVWLKLEIWNYQGEPLAHLFLNQINLFHSILWFFLSIFAFWLEDTVRWALYELGLATSCNKIYNLFWYVKQLFSRHAPKLERLRR